MKKLSQKGKQRNRFIWNLLFLLVFTCSCSKNTGTIHWITFIDTNDEHIGEMNENARKMLYKHFINVIDSSLSLAGYKSEVLDYVGNDVTPEKCIEIINNLKCEDTDIVVFYYLGHGSHSENDNTDLPSMMLGEKELVGRAVPLSWVHNNLTEKRARLVMTIASCSNIEQDLKAIVEAVSVPTIRKSNNQEFSSDNAMSPIQNAFLCTEGDILLCAAALGYDAFGGNTTVGNMDFLTAALINQFEELTNDNKFSWESLLDGTASQVKNITDSIQVRKQVPLYYYNLRYQE